MNVERRGGRPAELGVLLGGNVCLQPAEVESNASGESGRSGRHARAKCDQREGANFEAAPDGGGKGAVLKYVHEDPKSVARTVLKAHR
jgi:hypothetical protein